MCERMAAPSQLQVSKKNEPEPTINNVTTLAVVTRETLTPISTTTLLSKAMDDTLPVSQVLLYIKSVAYGTEHTHPLTDTYVH